MERELSIIALSQDVSKAREVWDAIRASEDWVLKAASVKPETVQMMLGLGFLTAHPNGVDYVVSDRGVTWFTWEAPLFKAA